ncbi:MAG: hypothetical protein H6Q31_619, partial [Bacteroidetes bacterium]|nr:hypothetical protein [Bacteroidota bacterium]
MRASGVFTLLLLFSMLWLSTVPAAGTLSAEKAPKQVFAARTFEPP